MSLKTKSKVMGVFIFLMCISILAGCSNKSANTDDKMSTSNVTLVQETKADGLSLEELQSVFKPIVKDNVFNNITAFDDRLLKAELCSEDKDAHSVVQKVTMMDLYGKELASYEISSDDAYRISTLTATDDGGFLFVLGFSDYEYIDNSGRASDKGYASRVIKCDNSGNLQFDTAYEDVEGNALNYCFENSGKFYLFGTIQTSETKIQGVYSSTDIFMTVLDQNGKIIKSNCISGSDFDSLNTAEMEDNQFVLSIVSQSDDGDFAGSESDGYPVDWTFKVDDKLQITEKEKKSGREYFDYRIGEKDGIAIYVSDEIIDDFDAGTPTALIDYGNFYMIVSENVTGEYENTPPFISSIWQYTETVYSAYDDSGSLVFRDSVDSSPDYDAWIEEYYSSMED